MSDSEAPDPWQRAMDEARDYLEHHEATGNPASLAVAGALLDEAAMLIEPHPEIEALLAEALRLANGEQRDGR